MYSPCVETYLKRIRPTTNWYPGPLLFVVNRFDCSHWLMRRCVFNYLPRLSVTLPSPPYNICSKFWILKIHICCILYTISINGKAICCSKILAKFKEFVRIQACWKPHRTTYIISLSHNYYMKEPANPHDSLTNISGCCLVKSNIISRSLS